MPRVIGCSSTGPEARKREQVGRGKKEGGKRRKEKERAKQRWRIGFDLIEIGGGGVVVVVMMMVVVVIQEEEDE
ncbi:hypothetical protein HN011_007628 [Eciton burchellii]|nr:hypothetical protein HN011_007628 [Eciton burchellii]